MDRYETTASKAETEIFKILSADGQVYRPWQLTNYALQSRTLKTTSDEVKLLLEREAYLRPGFKVENGNVYVPNLFVKLSGQKDNTYLQQDFFTRIGAMEGICQFYNSIRDFANFAGPSSSIEKVSEILNDKGLIDQHKLMASGIYRYSFLRIEYQKIVIDKINYIIENRESLFLSKAATGDLYRMVYILLNLDENLMTLFNNFDFQYHLPKVIIENSDRSSFTDDKAYALALLDLLGFDIIVHSPQSFADVENVFNRDLFDIFYFDDLNLQYKPDMPEKAGGRHFILKRRTLFTVLISLVVVSVIAYVIIGNFSGINSIESGGNGSDSTDAIAGTVDPGRVAVMELEENKTSQTVNAENPVEVNTENPAADSTESPKTGIAEIPEAVKPVIPENVRTESFNASDYVPFFKGTIIKIYLPADNVDPTINDVHINWIKPVNDLKVNEETYVMIEVEYSLVSEDGANLSINYNNNETVSRYQMENSRFPVSKGTGMCIFYIPVTPKSWSDGTPFQINSSLNHFEDPDPMKHNAFLAGTNLIPLKIK